MPKRKYQPRTEKQKQATMINHAIRQFAGLEFSLQRAGYYQMQQRVRELEEIFRHETNRKEKE